MNTTTTPESGTVVTARPWHNGVELPAQRGVLLTEHTDADYVLVWFPTLTVGEKVQAILTRKLTTQGPLDQAPRGWLAKAIRGAREMNREGEWRWYGVGAALERAGRARKG